MPISARRTLSSFLPMVPRAVHRHSTQATCYAATMPISVTVLGCGTPLPNLKRAGLAFVAHLSDEPVLIDCGPDTLSPLQRAEIEPKLVTKVFFTHLHL